MTEKREKGLTEINLGELHLDVENPRLPSQLHGGDPREIMEYLARTTSIEDLMNSIASHGYFDGEPLVVCPINGVEGYTVVEGNRRLTALKLLHNPNEINNPSAKVIKISQEAREKPGTIPVVIRNSRADVLPYLGFRHITGVKQWEPLAKARYIEQLFQITEPRDSPEVRYKDVARLIGSKSHHIKRSLDALAIYKLIEAKDFFGIDNLDEESIKFAVLSTALADDSISKFTGLSTKNEDDNFIPTNPIVDPTHVKIEEVEQLTLWLFKKGQGGKAKVAESRQIRDLSKVVDSPKALEALKGGSTLAYAFRMTSGVQDDFKDVLYQAEGLISSAVGMVATVEFEPELYELARSLNENIKMIGKTLKEKRKDEEDDF